MYNLYFLSKEEENVLMQTAMRTFIYFSCLRSSARNFQILTVAIETPLATTVVFQGR